MKPESTSLLNIFLLQTTLSPGFIALISNNYDIRSLHYILRLERVKSEDLTNVILQPNILYNQYICWIKYRPTNKGNNI